MLRANSFCVLDYSKNSSATLEKYICTSTYAHTQGGFPIEIETQISKLITYSLAFL